MKYFNLFSNILITKGANRILISDLQRNMSELHPLELYYLIEELKKNSIDEIIEEYDDDSKEVFQEYIDFLIDNDYGFISFNSWDKNFQKLSYEYQESSKISNIVVELATTDVLKKIAPSIITLEIKHIVLFSVAKLSYGDYIEIEKIFDKSAVESIEIFAPYDNFINKDFFDHLNEEINRIYSLVFYNCEKAPFKTQSYRFTLSYTDQNLKISSCGKVTMDYFNTNIQKITEAINHNSCLNKKIGIDIHGNIKNCPAMINYFGNIQNNSLEEIVKIKSFRKYWNITKDNIEVCKDCEFRYVCTDCRAYTEQSHISNESIDTSKPLKCGYDPYTNEWKEWSTNPLKQAAILNYNF